MGFVMFSLLFVFALYFQQVAGYSPLQGGLSFIPLCGAFALTGPLIGRNIHRTGHWPPMVAGLLALALGALLLRGLGTDGDYGAVWPAFLIIGVGYGITSTPMAAAVLEAVPPRVVGGCRKARLDEVRHRREHDRGGSASPRRRQGVPDRQGGL
jgi:MFS family permease